MKFKLVGLSASASSFDFSAFLCAFFDSGGTAVGSLCAVFRCRPVSFPDGMVVQIDMPVFSFFVRSRVESAWGCGRRSILSCIGQGSRFRVTQSLSAASRPSGSCHRRAAASFKFLDLYPPAPDSPFPLFCHFRGVDSAPFPKGFFLSCRPALTHDSALPGWLKSS